MSIYENLPSLDLTQSVHIKICTRWGRWGCSDVKFSEYLS